MKKIIFIILMLVVVVSGCSQNNLNKNSDKKVKNAELKLDVAYMAQPPTLDPHVTVAVATSEIAHHMFETLLAFDENNEPMPLLADSFVTSDDLKTITFNLRKGVIFHNGKEMKADDVVASMERWRELNGKANTYFSNSSFIKEDDYTVVLKMDQPYTIAKYILSAPINFAAIMPKEVVEKADSTGVTEFIGTGPFKFDEWKQDQFIKFTKHNEYQSNSEKIDGLVGKREALVNELFFHLVSDESIRAAGIQTGEYDISLEIPYDMFSTMERDSQLKFSLPTSGFSTVVFNKKNGLFSNEKARQALNMAVDKREVMTAAFADEKFYTLEHGLLSKSYSKWYNDKGKQEHEYFNPDEAKKLFEEAGYNGEELTILTTRDYEDQYQVAVVIQEYLNRIGVKTNIQVYDWPTLMDVREDEYFYDLMPMGYSPVTDPTQINFLDSRTNYTGWSNSDEIDVLLDEMMIASTDERAKELFSELQSENWSYLPAVKFGDFKQVIAYRSQIEGFEYFHGPMLWNVEKK